MTSRYVVAVAATPHKDFAVAGSEIEYRNFVGIDTAGQCPDRK
jgi:hypothetical protein